MQIYLEIVHSICNPFWKRPEWLLLGHSINSVLPECSLIIKIMGLCIGLFCSGQIPTRIEKNAWKKRDPLALDGGFCWHARMSSMSVLKRDRACGEIRQLLAYYAIIRLEY